MRIWQGKLRLCGPVTRDNKINPGKEVDARVVMGQTIVLYVSDCSDEAGNLLWSIGNVREIFPDSLLKALAESGNKI
jgi:hypothetical protein